MEMMVKMLLGTLHILEIVQLDRMKGIMLPHPRKHLVI